MVNEQMQEISSRSNRILVIDDDTDIWEAYKMILSPEQFESSSARRMEELLEEKKDDTTELEANFELSFASQGQDGYQLVQEAIQQDSPYSVAFIDIRMPPGWDGMETAVQIREIDPHMEIVIVTAYTDRSRDEIARVVQPADKLLYLRKPFDPDELKQVAFSLNEKWNISRKEEKQREALQKSEARYRSLVETTSDWVWEADKEGNFTYCSPVCEELYGYLPDELLGRSMFDILLTPEWAPEFKKFIQRRIDNIKGFHGIERLSTKKDGSQVFVESSVTPIVSGEHGVIGFHGIDRDITERKKTEEEKDLLEEKYNQAQKLEALGTLAGGIAHDINNILSPIIGYTELAEMAMEQGNFKINEHLKIIRESAHKATDLIRQILAFSRQQVLVTSTLNLNDIVESLGKMLNRLIREDITMEFDLADDLWLIEGDSGRLGQVLMNLVVNAKDAVGEGGRIKIQTENKIISKDDNLLNTDQKPLAGSFAVLSIIDDGSGMTKEIRERIFDPFFTTKPMGKGTGIGLSTVFGIVKQHGGHIIVNSQPDQGSIFTIYFLKTEKVAEADEELKTAPRKLEGNETILVVEDNEAVLQALRAGLEIFGYKVITANGGDKAAVTIQGTQEELDMLITDVVMPGRGGKSVAAIFREKFQDQPIIFISGYSVDIEPGDLLRFQRSFFMQKPIGPSEIAARIRAILDGEEEPAKEISFDKK